jgi:1,4-alpha-glucan branching enzyme
MVRALPDEVEFLFEDPHAREVELRGCGPDGHEQHWTMLKDHEGRWHARVRLDGGWFEFRYLVDRRFWAIDGATRTIVVASDGSCRSRIDARFADAA